MACKLGLTCWPFSDLVCLGGGSGGGGDGGVSLDWLQCSHRAEAW